MTLVTGVTLFLVSFLYLSYMARIKLRVPYGVLALCGIHAREDGHGLLLDSADFLSVNAHRTSSSR